MDIQATQPPSTSSAYPRWVMLKHYGEREDESSCLNADAKTLAAAARTTTSLLICVAFRLPPPPEVSRLCFHFPDAETIHAEVVAAHGDSVLIEICFRKERLDDYTTNYFVYNAGAAAAAAESPRPPSLSLLTPYYLTEQEERYWPRPRGPMPRRLDKVATGLLRRGGDELAVAELKMVAASNDQLARKVAELLLLRSGEWSVRRPPLVSNEDGEGGALPSSWRTDSVVPVGDHLLCWMDLINGVLFSNVFEENPWLRYVPLPVNSYFGRASHRNVCVTASGGALKFVDIFPRCCCGGAGGTDCRRSHDAYTIHTWMLRTDDMVWVMDGIVDATELWALDAYQGLPRVRLGYPVVSMDDPHVICFVVEDDDHEETTVWLIMLDTRSKTLRSVYRYHEGQRLYLKKNLIPSTVSDYLNSYPSGNNGDTSMQPSPLVVVNELQTNDVNHNNSLQSSAESHAEPVQVSPILVALKQIPGLARDDMLKAYSILCNGNGRRFKNLLGLPMDLRKDWLLMEIKASEACFFCSTCAIDLQHA